MLSTKFPVYSGGFAKAGEQIGEVEIDGIDLDVELGGARLSTDVANAVAALVKSLRSSLPSDKLITLAAFSVGADPENNCTVPKSIHCGEAIPLLTQIADEIDLVNVMAYDAGKTFAETAYKTAMANYAKYVGGSKVVLGLDNQSEWPGFIESQS